jgi:TonB family protein
MKMKLLPLFLIVLSSACAEPSTRLDPSFAGLSFEIPVGWKEVRVASCIPGPPSRSWNNGGQNKATLGLAVSGLYLPVQTAEEFCAAVEKDFQENGKDVTKRSLPDLNGLKRLELTCVRSMKPWGLSADGRVCYLLHWKPASPVIVNVSFYCSAAWSEENVQIWDQIKKSEGYSLDGPRSPIFFKSCFYLTSTPAEDFTIRIRQKAVAGSTGSPPIPISQPLPEYPLPMRKTDDSGGVVSVRFVVGKDGVTSDIRVLKATDKSFGDAAANAVKHWTFVPSTTAIGEPVPLEMEYVISFDISGAD